MTCYPFWNKTTKRPEYRTAGGWTKASTGYTFKNSDKKSSQLVAFLQQDRVKRISYEN
jgi:lycopene beta-cyclase